MTRTELINIIKRKRSLLCVGLDTELHRLPRRFRDQHDGVRAFNHAVVQAIFKTFPGAKLDAVRRKGDQTSLVAGLGEFVGEEPPPAEEYPADDDIPESEF